MGRAHAHHAGARSRSEARRVVGDDGAGLRPGLAAASRRIRAGMSSVVVTGAAKGIGAGIVEAFAKAGWSVVAVGRDKAPLQQTAARVSANIVPPPGAVPDPATTDAAVQDGL